MMQLKYYTQATDIVLGRLVSEHCSELPEFGY